MDLQTLDKCKELLKVSMWYVEDFHNRTSNASYREKAWTHYREIEDFVEVLNRLINEQETTTKT